jgi:threonine dehydrogenase-like Zn-dependent dehydrogenase
VERARVALGESAAIVFDCVAHQSTVEASIQMALKGGTVVAVGGARRRPACAPGVPNGPAGLSHLPLG